MPVAGTAIGAIQSGAILQPLISDQPIPHDPSKFVMLGSANRSVLSHLREDGDLLHLYLYHFLYETGEPVEVEVALPGAGAVHRIDAWTGTLQTHSGVRQDGGRTIATVALAPGETALLTLDRGAAAAPPSDPIRTETVTELGPWAIAVESWDAGDAELITEDRGLGYETREVRPTTAVTRIDGLIDIFESFDLGVNRVRTLRHGAKCEVAAEIEIGCGNGPHPGRKQRDEAVVTREGASVGNETS